MPELNIAPIPWTVEANDDWVRVVSGTMDVCIVSSFGARLANARLIATAPLLYAALEQVLYSKKPLSETIEYAETVLSLARGFK